MINLLVGLANSYAVWHLLTTVKQQKDNGMPVSFWTHVLGALNVTFAILNFLIAGFYTV